MDAEIFTWRYKLIKSLPIDKGNFNTCTTCHNRYDKYHIPTEVYKSIGKEEQANIKMSKMTEQLFHKR